MIHFTAWLRNLYETEMATSRGGQGKDWVSADDYDPRTPVGGGQYLKQPHRHAGYLARSQGQARTTNPHDPKTQPHTDWHAGWDDHHFLHEPRDHAYGAAD